MCEEWLSNISNTGCSAVGLACNSKCCMNSRKFSEVIQPVAFGCPVAAVPGGAVDSHWDWKLTHGNTKKGGIAFPRALTAQHSVMRLPLSWETVAPASLLSQLLSCVASDSLLYCNHPSLIYVVDWLRSKPSTTTHNFRQVVKKQVDISSVEVGHACQRRRFWFTNRECRMPVHEACKPVFSCNLLIHPCRWHFQTVWLCQFERKFTDVLRCQTMINLCCLLYIINKEIFYVNSEYLTNCLVANMRYVTFHLLQLNVTS